MDLNELSKEIYEGNKERGFWEDHFEALDLANINSKSNIIKAIDNAFLSQKIMLMVTELGEAQEALRDNHFCKLNANQLINLENSNDDIFKENFQDQVKNTFEDELADSIIRVLDTCGARGIDINKHILLKLRFNKFRNRKHGKQF